MNWSDQIQGVHSMLWVKAYTWRQSWKVYKPFVFYASGRCSESQKPAHKKFGE